VGCCRSTVQLMSRLSQNSTRNNAPMAPAPENDNNPNLLDMLREIAVQLGRIANHFDPAPPDIVGTR